MKKTSDMCSCGIYDHDAGTRKVRISELHDFEGHPFKVEHDMELFELMRSIEEKGNLQREHIKPSEKAFAYKMKLDAMKQQGKKLPDTLSQVGTKLNKQVNEDGKAVLRSDEILARQVGESRNQIARYIRLTNLIPKILDMVDEGKIAFTIAVELSYLKEEEQYELHAVMDLEQCTPSLSQANRMKRMSQSGMFDMDAIYSVLEEEKPNQREQIKIRADTLADYFPDDFTPKQKVELIEKLVKEWYEKRISVKEIGKLRK